jgi:signal transduction histidine kinase
MPKPANTASWATSDAADAASERAVRTWLRQRPLVVGLFSGVTVGLLAWGGLPGWRLAVVAALVAVAVGQAVAVAVAVAATGPRRSHASADQDVLWSMIISLTALLVNITVTGGLASPLLPALLGILARILTLGSMRGVRALLVGLTAWVVAAAVLSPWLAVPLAAPAWKAILIWSFLVVTAYLTHTVRTLSGGLADCSHTLAAAERGALEDSILRSRQRECVGARVAHDLRAPLGTLAGLVEQQRGSTDADDRARRRLDVIDKELARMDRILKEYLSFSRPHEALQPAPVDLGALVDNVLALLEDRAGAAGVRLMRSGPGALVTADGRRLSEALLNLASNALEATPRGGAVKVVVEPAAGGGNVQVCDSGAGMGSAVLEKVGTPFFTTREGGTGLGVALARAAITSHGGTLSFRSLPGAGTTAEIFIPGQRPRVEPAADKETLTRPLPQAGEETQQGTLTRPLPQAGEETQQGHGVEGRGG